MLNLITVDDVMALSPCEDYPRERVESLIGDGVTVMQALDLDMPTVDLFWVILREEFIPAEVLHLFACDVAESAIPIWDKRYPDDDRPRKAIEVKRAWLRGEATDDELADAARAARAAARDARAAARAAARDAAYAAAYAAYAADAAAYAAAYAAACAAYAARDAARDAQRDMLRKRMQEWEASHD